MPDPPPTTTIGRRRFLAVGGALIGALAALPVSERLLALIRAAPGDAWGPLGPPDAAGIRVPEGFVARVIGRTGDVVAATGHRWHPAPDGGACFAVAGSDGHVYVSNSEVGAGGGGVSAVRFDRVGRIEDARTVLAGTSRNCSGGATPWGTWLSCEENGPTGLVWECDPFGGPAAVRPALGAFNHEAVAVDAVRKCLYLTEDDPAGRLYRFVPDRWPDLTAGRLQAASVSGSALTWRAVDPAVPDRSPSTTAFDGGEGVVVDGDELFVATKGDRRIWRIDLAADRLEVFHDCVARPDTPLSHVDNLAIDPRTGHLLVADDGGDMDLCVLTRTAGGPVVSRLVRFEGHAGSEVTGPAISPDGRFLYLSSQRGTDGRGITVQVAVGGRLGVIDSPATGTGRAVREPLPAPE